MFKQTAVNSFFIAAWLLISVSACNNSGDPLIDKQSGGGNAADINKLIAAGIRVENINNDSLQIIAARLYDINKASGDKKALVYAEMFDTNYYWQGADHKKAMTLAIKCLADAEKYHIRPALSQIYGTIANLHKETTNYPMAFKAADSGLNAAIADKDSSQIISFLGLKAMFTRGLSLRKGQPGPDKSIELNLAALQIAESSPKYERLRIRFYDNICQYYKDQRDFAKAYYYGNKGVELATKYNQQRSLTYAYSWLGQANYFEGKQAKGIALLDSALKIATKLKEPYRVMEIHGHIYDCYISTNDYKNALAHYTRMRVMRDSLKVLDNVKQISELQVKYETAKKDKEISLLNDKAEIEALQRNAIILVLILLVTIAALFYIKEKKRKDLLISEKLLLDEELKNAGLELLYFTENLKQKNEVIEEFKAEIEHLQLQHISAADRENLDNLIKAHIMTDENWDSFKKLFAKVHTGFFDAIKQKFPYITATDARILSLIKLQLSNNEMANMLGITVEGVKKSKQRLRKKIELNKDESIETIVAAI
jgi:DNA-binding CsgD family transcriptional regulator/tetratricopeptide (TPR) repeat protein